MLFSEEVGQGLAQRDTGHRISLTTQQSFSNCHPCGACRFSLGPRPSITLEQNDPVRMFQYV